MFQRLWRLFQTLFRADSEPDLEAQAQTQMRQLQAQSRLRAVQAITEKNTLEQLIASTESFLEELQSKLTLAQQAGDEGDIYRLNREIGEYQSYLAIKRRKWDEATRTAESAKEAIRQQEERIRQKTEEALALQAAWKNSQTTEPFLKRSHIEGVLVVLLAFFILACLLLLIYS